jgi:hypothetical protein
VDGNYEGEHWLASFALRAFEAKKIVTNAYFCKIIHF